MSFRNLEETIIAQASAPGAGLRGIVRLSGPDCVDALNSVLKSKFVEQDRPFICEDQLFPWEPERPVPARIYFWPEKHGYTGQKAIELHLWSVQPILDALIRRMIALSQGMLRLAEPGEFTLRAFLSGRLDLTQAEAVLGIIEAQTPESLKVALGQLAGGLGGPLHRIQEQLLNTLVDLEAGFDFPEEDITFCSQERLHAQLGAVAEELQRIREQIRSRNVSGTFPHVALIGLPNAGKSSLYNRIAGPSVHGNPTNNESGDRHYQEYGFGAIVSPIPGTTRDYLETTVSYKGQTFVLVDTAGIETATSKMVKEEQRGPDEQAQELTRKMLQEADLLLFCLESQEQLAILQEYRHKRKGPILWVLTKCDSFPKRNNVCLENEGDVGLRDVEQEEFIPTSAKTGFGIDRLKEAIGQLLLKQNAALDVVPSTALRCRHSIEQALSRVEEARVLLDSTVDEVLIASELRLALDHLGQILGTVHTEDILDQVFSRFCIGK